MALFTKNLRKHIFVHPAQQDKLHDAVKTTLLRDKRKFSDLLEGALLDVSNPRVVGSRYLIVDGFLSMEVMADFEVFCPTVGMSLQGFVNKISKGHIGCLVMDVFNASIAKLPNSAMTLEIGDACEFTVTEVIINGDILSLRGSLSNDYYEEGNVQDEEEKDCDSDKKKTDDKEVKKFDLGKEKADDRVSMKESTKVQIKQEETTDYDLFGRGVLTQADPSSKSPRKSKKIKEEPQFDWADKNNTIVDGGLKSPKKRTKSPKKEKDEISSSDLSISGKLSSQDETSSPSKKAKKSKKKEKS